MAFGARELRLILSIQSYGTGNIARLRRDILALQRTTQTANALQTAVQDDILRKQTQLTRVQDKISRIERATIARRVALEGRASRAADRFAKQRERTAAKELALANTIAAKRLQIARSEDRARAMQGSAMERFGVREAQLATQRLRIQAQLANLPAKEATMQSRILSNKATIIQRERQLAQLRGKSLDLERMASGSLAGFGQRTREVALRYRAALKTAESLSIQQKNMTRQAGILASQLEGITAQERLIKAQKFEQAAAMARQVELVGLQHTQLAAIEARQAEIATEVAMIDKAEAQVNAELRQQLALLQAENVQLDRARVAAGELAAEIALGNGPMLARAAMMDKLIDKQQRLMQMENRHRMRAHVARTIQFGGLVGLATVVGAGNAFANFNKQLVLAATQARAVDAPLSDVAKQAEFIAQGMDKGGRHIKGIMDLMQEFPATGDDMAAAAYDIFSSMDVTTESGLKLLRTFNQLAVATGSDLATAVDSGITVLNNFGAASGNVNDQMNLMMTIIRFGRMRLEDLNAMLEKVAPAATASGMALEDVAGAMIAVTRLQPSQRVGATGIARLLQTFRDPDFQRGAAKFGADITIGADAVGRLKPLPQIIKQFAESFGLFQRFGGPGQLFQSLTATGRGRGIGRASRIEAQNAFTFLVGHVDQYLALQRRATSETQEFAVALKAMSESPGVRWQIFINQMRAFVLTVGESVLPALLNVADKVAVAIKWFDGLNKSTRGALGTFLTYGSVAALLVGTLGNLVFSLLAAATNMRIMRLSTQLMNSELVTARTQATLFAASMQMLAGIGIIAIPIVLQIIKGGDPGLWDFLGGAAAGALGGAMIGAPFGPPGMAVGAAVGGLTVPVVLQITSMFQDGENSPRSAAEKAYKEYRDAFAGFGHRFADGKKISGKPLGFEEWLAKHPKLMRQHKKFLKENMSDEESILEQYRKNSNAFMKEQIDKWTKHSQDLDKAYKEQNSVAEKEAQRALQIEKARTNAIQQATEARTEKIEQMTDKILQIYDQFEEQNRQALGAFAQGPVMQGILGNVFGGINDLLRQFGVQIPIPFQILRRDMDMQLSYFRRWRTALDSLIKRGAPLGLVQEIQSMGIAQGLPVAEGLLAGGKAGWRSLIKVWQQGQDALQRATKADTDAQLREWEKYGKDIAFAILRGLADEPTQAALRAGYQKYITSTFGSILQAEFANEVATAMAQAIEDIEAATAAAGMGTTTGGTKGSTSSKSGKTRTDPLGRFLRQAETARRRLLASRAPLRLAVDAAVNPLGAGGQLIVPAEQAAINRARAQQTQAQRAFRRARSGAIGLIQGQISRQERRNPNAPRYAITYNNETFYFNSNMTAQQIYRAIQAKRRKRRKKQTKN